MSLFDFHEFLSIQPWCFPKHCGEDLRRSIQASTTHLVILLLPLALLLFSLFAIVTDKHQYMLCLKSPQGSTGIGCIDHFSISQDEIGGLKVTVLTIKVSTDLVGFFPHIQPVNDRKSELVLFNHFSSVFLLIDR